MSSQSTSSQGDLIYCSACGHPNPPWRYECEECKTSLVKPEAGGFSRSRERPGCVTAYAILLWIGAVGATLGGVAAGISEGEVLVVLGGLVAGGLELGLGIGIWRLKNWARIIVMVLQGLGVIVGLISLFMGNLISIVSLAVGGYILYWFASHGEYFD